MRIASKKVEAGRNDTNGAQNRKEQRPNYVLLCARSGQSSVTSTSVLQVGKRGRVLTMRTHTYLERTEMSCHRRCRVVPENDRTALSEKNVDAAAVASLM